MKCYYFIIISFIVGFFLPIPKYVELNHLMIVDRIGLDCLNNQYTLYLKEIIPKKGDNGINYDFQLYSGDGSSISEAYDNLLKKNHKKVFLKDVQELITNCVKSDKSIYYFSVKPNHIVYTKKNIKKELK